jgi:hypothetical protein
VLKAIYLIFQVLFRLGYRLVHPMLLCLGEGKSRWVRLLLGGSEAISPIGRIRVILNAVPAGIHYRADSLQHGRAYLPELDQDRWVGGLVRREI